MFLTRAGIKRLMQNAYKGGGLRIRNNGKGISITGSTWAVFFLAGEMPKETLGDLISMVGELPGKHECYKADKDGNQMEIWDDTLMDAMEIAESGGRDLEVTPVTVDSFPYSMRILQESNREITLIDDRIRSIVQPSLVDVDDDETLPNGPTLCRGNIIGTPVHTICWSNNRMAFCAMPIITHDDSITEIIRGMEDMALWGFKSPGDKE